MNHMSDLPPLWPPQVRAIDAVHDAFMDHARICLCMPTGAGKSRVCCELVRDWSIAGERTMVVTNRRLLVEQLRKTLSDFGFTVGVRARGEERNHKAPVQIVSLQSEFSQVSKNETHRAWDPNRLIIDEAHLNSGPSLQAILTRYEIDGAKTLGLTATPIDLGGIYEKLIVGAKNSEVRACGALVPADHYGPDEPDCSRIKKELCEWSEGDCRKTMLVQNLWGSLWAWFGRLNPDRRPSILFAPGIPESIWFAEQFHQRGISAAHIDSQHVWYRGELVARTPELVERIFKESKTGEVNVICNRFVLREGIDLPWLAHAIIGTVFSARGTYLQSIGRILRAFPGKDRATIQDHGGNWWRHGSVNADCAWSLGDTERIIQGVRAERLRRKLDAEPTRCDKCGRIVFGLTCPCGNKAVKRMRPVRQIDGSMRELTGDIYRPRITRMKNDTLKLWKSMFYRMKNADKTFSQARGFFFYKHHYFPPNDLPGMPKDERDWFRKISDVAVENLYGDATYATDKK